MRMRFQKKKLETNNRYSRRTYNLSTNLRRHVTTWQLERSKIGDHRLDSIITYEAEQFLVGRGGGV